jgi:hypothetical protein
MATKQKILVVRKMSPLEYYYGGKSIDPLLNAGHENHNDCINKLEKILQEKDVEFKIITRKELSGALVEDYNFIVSAGGDGTVIAVAAYNKNKPQLNIKSEEHSIGALCQKDMESSLIAVLSGNYSVENWNRAEVILDGNFIGRALNEICVGEKLRFDKYSKYLLNYSERLSNKNYEEEQGGSGIVIVTGTGSTAWPSAFEPFSRQSSYFKFKTILIHSGKIDSGEAEDLSLIYKGHEGKFSIDTVEYNFPRNSVLEIKKSDFPLKVIIPNITKENE